MSNPRTRREFASPPPPLPPRPLALRARLAPAALAFLLGIAGALGLAACRHDYGIESREAAVHVWLEAPAATAADQSVEVAVTVAGQTAANGRYRFPAGNPLQEVNTVYVPSGNREVVVTRGGARIAAGTVRVGQIAFVRVRLEGAGASVIQDRYEPGSAR